MQIRNRHVLTTSELNSFNDLYVVELFTLLQILVMFSTMLSKRRLRLIQKFQSYGLNITKTNTHCLTYRLQLICVF